MREDRTLRKERIKKGRRERGVRKGEMMRKLTKGKSERDGKEDKVAELESQYNTKKIYTLKKVKLTVFK